MSPPKSTIIEAHPSLAHQAQELLDAGKGTQDVTDWLSKQLERPITVQSVRNWIRSGVLKRTARIYTISTRSSGDLSEEAAYMRKMLHQGLEQLLALSRDPTIPGTARVRAVETLSMLATSGYEMALDMVETGVEVEVE